MVNFSKRVLGLEVSAIKEIAAEAGQNAEVISLAQGLPSFSTPQHIRKATANALLTDEEGIGTYTLYSGISELKEAIARKLIQEDKRLKIDAGKEIFVTVGAMEGLAATILSVVGTGAEVILPAPNYPAHISQVKLAGGVPRFVPLQADKVWTWDIANLAKAITEKTELIILTNPGNPTGCVFDETLLREIVGLAKQHNLWVLADETYSYLTYDGLDHVSLGIFRREYHKLIVVRSFSKEYAMTGWRIGYVYAPEELVTQALKIHDALIGCPASIAQKGALIALNGSQEIVEEFRKELAERRKLFCAKLDRLEDYFAYIKPQGAYYVWVRLKRKKQQANSKPAAKFALELLRKAQVAVVPGEAFGPHCAEYVRMCFAASRENIIEAFARMDKFLTAEITSITM